MKTRAATGARIPVAAHSLHPDVTEAEMKRRMRTIETARKPRHGETGRLLLFPAPLIARTRAAERARFHRWCEEQWSAFHAQPLERARQAQRPSA